MKETVKKDCLPLLTTIQRCLAQRVEFRDRIETLNNIGGCDVYYFGKYAYVCVCLIRISDFSVVEKVIIKQKVEFPYISGYFCFREGPLLLEALDRLNSKPDCLLVDGNGILHPRGMGLASFIGIFARIPTIGCAKTLLVGDYRRPSVFKGDFSYIKLKRKVVGIALRTKNNVREIFVSVGWGVNILRAKDIVLGLSKYRIPEPIRLAHYFANMAVHKKV